MIRLIRSRERPPVTWNCYRVRSEESPEGAVISKGNFCEAAADSVIRTGWEDNPVDAFYAGLAEFQDSEPPASARGTFT